MTDKEQWAAKAADMAREIIYNALVGDRPISVVVTVDKPQDEPLLLVRDMRQFKDLEFVMDKT
jgi:hypothetical protein